jgi:cytoskeletal protein RodZ
MKRVLGWIFTLVVIAVVVFAALNWGNYTSMCFDKSAEEIPAVAENEIEEPAQEPLNVQDTENTEEESTEDFDATESTL